MKPPTLVLILCFHFLPFSSGEKVKYVGYKSYRFVPEKQEQLDILQSLVSNNALIFFTQPSNLGKPVDVMFAPHALDIADRIRPIMPHELMIEDVESVIQEHEEMHQQIMSTFTEDVVLPDTYMTLKDMYAFMEKTASQSDNCQLIEYGKSFQGRPLRAMYFSDPSSTDEKPVTCVECGCHAREWISPATCCRMAQELADPNSAMAPMLKVYDVCLVPVSNPDGYEYSWTTNRLWRKSCNINQGSVCTGTDMNRNWSYGFGKSGTSTDPCSDIYHGGFPYSTPEVTALRLFLLGLKNLLCFFSFHSYSQMILLCDGCNEMNTPYEDFNKHLDIAKAGVRAFNASGTQYTAGKSNKVLYSACGTSADSVRNEKIAPICYTFELRDQGDTGFLLPPNQIAPCAEETKNAFVEMHREITKTVLLQDVTF